MIDEARLEHPGLSVSGLCGLLGVGRSWYYAKPTTAETAQRDVELRGAIEEIVLEFPGYGYRRVAKQLQRDGRVVNHKRVLRIMREESLLCQLKRRFVATTDSGHGFATYPNLLRGVVPDRLDQAWVADIAYVRLPTTFAYLACVLDAYSRKCVGWAFSRSIDTRLAPGAPRASLGMALERRRPPRGFIHHSDRGVQYASGEYVARLGTTDARVSMSAKGNPYENAKAESFMNRSLTNNSRGRRCTSSSTERSRRRRATSGASLRTCTIRGGSTRAWATRPRSSSRQPTPPRRRLRPES